MTIEWHQMIVIGIVALPFLVLLLCIFGFNKKSVPLKRRVTQTQKEEKDIV